MIKVISGKRYDTSKAEEIFTHWNGKMQSDFRYRHKRLFRTTSGAWFLHHRGGAMTDMAVPVGNNGSDGSESIEPLGDDDAFGFLQAHSDEDDALAAIEKFFADRVVDA